MRLFLHFCILLTVVSFMALVVSYNIPSSQTMLETSKPAVSAPKTTDTISPPFPETASSSQFASTTTTTVVTLTETQTFQPSSTTTVTEPFENKVSTATSTIINTTTKSVDPQPVITNEPKSNVDQNIKSFISWGVFAGSNPTVIHDFETRVGVNPDYLAYFIHWGNGGGALPAFLSDYAYKKDRTLVIFWEASDYKIGGTDQPSYSYNAILRGDWDDYFESFAKQLKRYEGPIILIPFSELNGNWTPWSGTKNGNTPELAVAAFQYVHGYFSDIPNVQIGWAVNSVSVPQTSENQIERYYPGDEYVDIVGVDGFNMGDPWLSFDEIFGNALRTVSQYGKPVFVFSFGSAEGPKKAAWLQDALETQMPRYPQLTGWVYFNQNKERNWLLWSDEDTFQVFKDYITD